MLKKIAVIIPAYNEEENIGGAIKSLLTAGLSKRQIYVVNDCSLDKTLKILEKYGVNILSNEKNLGKAESIKRLVETFYLADRYEWIALLDADSMIHENYFKEIINSINKHPQAALIIGQVKSIKYNWLTSLRTFEYTLTHEIFKTAQSKLSVISVGPGCASVYKNEVIKKIDFVTGVATEDMDWTIQIHRKKLGRTVYNPKAVVYTYDPRTIKDYLKQINRWYTGNWQVIFRHKIPLKLKKIDLEIGLLNLEGLFWSILLFIVYPSLLFLSPKLLFGLIALKFC